MRKKLEIKFPKSPNITLATVNKIRVYFENNKCIALSINNIATNTTTHFSRTQRAISVLLRDGEIISIKTSLNLDLYLLENERN